MQNNIDRNAQTAESGSQSPLDDRRQVSAPTLPRDGVALRDMGKKFAAHPVAGMGYVAVYSPGMSSVCEARP